MTSLRLATAFAVVVAVAASVPGRAIAATDKRELQAREDFAAGRYQDALELFAKLYAEKLHPNYLRNIGRCYQNLGDPDKAISAFREYLRKAKGISADERAEVEGYIKEMEALAASKHPATPPPPTTPPPDPQSHLAATPPPAQPPAVTITTTPPPPAQESSPIYTRWWFWTAIGAVALVGGLAAAGVFTKHNDAACDMGRTCQ